MSTTSPIWISTPVRCTPSGPLLLETHRVLLQDLRPRYGRERTRCSAALGYSEPEPMRRASLKASLRVRPGRTSRHAELLDNDYDSNNSLYATAAAARALHAPHSPLHAGLPDGHRLRDEGARKRRLQTRRQHGPKCSDTDTYLTYMWNYDSKLRDHLADQLHHHLLRRRPRAGVPQLGPGLHLHLSRLCSRPVGAQHYAASDLRYNAYFYSTRQATQTG